MANGFFTVCRQYINWFWKDSYLYLSQFLAELFYSYALWMVFFLGEVSLFLARFERFERIEPSDWLRNKVTWQIVRFHPCRSHFWRVLWFTFLRESKNDGGSNFQADLSQNQSNCLKMWITSKKCEQRGLKLLKNVNDRVKMWMTGLNFQVNLSQNQSNCLKMWMMSKKCERWGKMWTTGPNFQANLSQNQSNSLKCEWLGKNVNNRAQFPGYFKPKPVKLLKNVNNEKKMWTTSEKCEQLGLKLL